MDDVTDQVRALTRSGAYGDALSMCDAAIRSRDGRERAGLWRLRAYVHRRMRLYEEAVSDTSEGLAIDPNGTHLLFDRARNYIELERFEEAGSDLSRIEAEERLNNTDAYGVLVHLLSAICYVRLGKPDEALRVCSKLPDDASIWALCRLQTKSHLEREAQMMLASEP